MTNLTIQKSNVGYSVIDENGEYIHDARGNNTFDTYDEAEDLMLYQLVEEQHGNT